MSNTTLIEYFYKFEKEKAEEPFLYQPFGNDWGVDDTGTVGTAGLFLGQWRRSRFLREVVVLQLAKLDLAPLY